MGVCSERWGAGGDRWGGLRGRDAGGSSKGFQGRLECSSRGSPQRAPGAAAHQFCLSSPPSWASTVGASGSIVILVKGQVAKALGHAELVVGEGAAAATQARNKEHALILRVWW